MSRRPSPRVCLQPAISHRRDKPSQRRRLSSAARLPSYPRALREAGQRPPTTGPPSRRRRRRHLPEAPTRLQPPPPPTPAPGGTCRRPRPCPRAPGGPRGLPRAPPGPARPRRPLTRRRRSLRPARRAPAASGRALPPGHGATSAPPRPALGRERGRPAPAMPRGGAQGTLGDVVSRGWGGGRHVRSGAVLRGTRGALRGYRAAPACRGSLSAGLRRRGGGSPTCCCSELPPAAAGPPPAPPGCGGPPRTEGRPPPAAAGTARGGGRYGGERSAGGGGPRPRRVLLSEKNGENTGREVLAQTRGVNRGAAGDRRAARLGRLGFPLQSRLVLNACCGVVGLHRDFKSYRFGRPSCKPCIKGTRV